MDAQSREPKEAYSSPDGLRWPIPYVHSHPCAVEAILSDALPPDTPQPGTAFVAGPQISNLGELDRLPLEVVLALLQHLDIRSLLRFKCVNRRAVDIADSVSSYKALKTHAPDAIRGIKATKSTQASMTCAYLYKKLCSKECDNCGELGFYLSILTGERVCYNCFTRNKKYCVDKAERVIDNFALTGRNLQNIPFIKSVPGTYSSFQIHTPLSLTLFDLETVRKASIALHGSAEAMEKHVERLRSRKIRQETRKGTGLGHLTSSSNHSPRRAGAIIHCSRRPRPLEDQVSREMAIVRFPWLIPATQTEEWGFYCFACRNEFWGENPICRVRFTDSTFKAHLIEYGPIKWGHHFPIEA